LVASACCGKGFEQFSGAEEGKPCNRINKSLLINEGFKAGKRC
jgi:hypothetical protein